MKNKENSKYKYFTGNLALFTISNFVSKILVFLLVPFYTNVLSTADYGIADVMQTTLLLLVPALTINMGEAALRFGIDRSDKRNEIFRIGLKFVLIACASVAACCGIGYALVKPEIKWYLFLFIFLFLTNCLYEYLILFFQGCEKVKIVVCGSVFSTVVLLVSNIIFLLVIKIGLNGYLLSQMLAFSLASILMLILGRKFMPDVVCIPGKKKRQENKDKEFEKELVSYGIPMIAYSTGSWINNAADRYLVSFIKGVAVNGVYGVAYKIPAILTVFQRIFAQAWQMSATKSYKDDNSKEFFSSMYTFYNTFMVVGCGFLILIVRLLAFFMFKKDFYEAWRFVPPLLISVVFGALTGFLGSICLAYKDSKAMGFATGVGALVNIILNIILIPKYGAMGAASATGVSYFLMYFMAFIKMSGHVKLDVNLPRDYFAYILLIIEALFMINGRALAMIYGDVVLFNIEIEYYAAGFVFLLILISYIKDIIKILKKLKSLPHKERDEEA
ncbi:MAG: oligosaccharide flippase family protein [Lachnospiraceae bacterium]|nr:oligosaccharide flippase family protein [Lachnospiraceae bacterium]